MIPYGRQDVTSEDIDAVVAVLQSDFLTQGPAVPRFESAVAGMVGAAHAVATCNATAALHLACVALHLQPGQRLWTSAITFAASANCARYCGADVDFVDIDPDTWNMSVSSLRQKLVEARERDRLPHVVVSVHLTGQPPEQEAIHALSGEFGFRIIEDASHAIGASRDGEPVGSCRWSDITVFSFHPVKIITTGEGGMALTNDESLADRMRMLRSHGITRDPSRMTASGPAHYEQVELGWNYRMTDMQAALGTSQLARLDEYVAQRNAIARRYDRDLSGLPLRLPKVLDKNQSAFHLYVVRLADAGLTNQDVIARLRSADIGATLHYPAVHLHPYYRQLGFHAGMFPEAERYAGDAISLPLFPRLGNADQTYVIETLATVLAS